MNYKFAMKMDMYDKLKFGKYKDNTLNFLHYNDKPYFRWLLDEGRIILTESGCKQLMEAGGL